MYDSRSVELDRTVFLLDVFVTVFVFVGSYFFRGLLVGEGEYFFNSHVLLLPLVIALVTSFLSYFGAYGIPRKTSNWHYTWAVFKGVSVAIGVLLALLFFFEIEYVSRLVIVLFASVEFVILVLVRIVIRNYFLASVASGKHSLRVMIVGSGDRAKALVAELKKQADWGFKIVGHIDPDPSRIGRDVDGVPVIGTVETIHDCLKDHVVDELIIAIPRKYLTDVEPIVHACEVEGVKLRLMADVFSLHVARTSLTILGHTPLLTLEPVALDPAKLLVKRIFDCTVTLIAMPVVIPILIFAALAVKMDSPGPVIFVQHRVGLRKRLFPMFKFRSMYEDAEERLKELEHLNEADGPNFKIENDPRVTKVGNFLRKTSIDELPQLFNVLRGEMSLVGPRPMSTRDVNLFDRGVQRKRFSVTPGLTCIWQISGRSDLSFDQWLELDLQYINEWSLGLDFQILVKTIPAVLFSKGAV